MHLVGAELGALMAEMGKVQGDRVVLGLAEGERRPRAVVVTADEDVVGSGQRRATDQGVDAVQIAAALGTTPIVERLVEAGFGADKGWLVGRAPRGRVGNILVHQHGPVPALNPLPRTVVRWVFRRRIQDWPAAIRKNKPRTPPWLVQVNEGLTA